MLSRALNSARGTVYTSPSRGPYSPAKYWSCESSVHQPHPPWVMLAVLACLPTVPSEKYSVAPYRMLLSLSVTLTGWLRSSVGSNAIGMRHLIQRHSEALSASRSALAAAHAYRGGLSPLMMSGCESCSPLGLVQMEQAQGSGPTLREAGSACVMNKRREAITQSARAHALLARVPRRQDAHCL